MNNEPKQDCKHEEGWKMVEDKFGSYHVASGACRNCGMSMLDWGESQKDSQ